MEKNRKIISKNQKIKQTKISIECDKNDEELRFTIRISRRLFKLVNPISKLISLAIYISIYFH